MKKKQYRIGVLIMAVFMLMMSFSACSNKVEEEEQQVGMPNPWQETDSSKTAAEGAGIDEMVIADGIKISLGEVKVDKYRYMDGMIQANVEFPAVEMTIRKGRPDTAAEEGDISGDYGEYKNSWTQSINTLDVNCYGNREGDSTKTLWKSDDYLYSVTAFGLGGDTDYGLSADDLALLVAGIDAVSTAGAESN